MTLLMQESKLPYRVSALDWLLFTALVVAWGCSFAMSKVALREIDAVWIAAGRLAVGALVLLVMAALQNQLPGLDARKWAKYALLGIVGNSLPFLINTWGMHFVSSGIAGLLMGTIPLLIVVFAHFALPGERLTPAKSAGFLLGFCGIAMLVDPASLAGLSWSGGTAIGELAILAACVAYALHSIFAKRLGFDKPFEQSLGVLTCGAICSIVVATFTEPSGMLGKSASAYLAVLGLGLLPTGLATVVMYKLMDRTSPTFVTMSNYLVPVFAVIFGAVTLHEAIGWQVVAALAFILSGIYVSRIRRRPSQ